MKLRLAVGALLFAGLYLYLGYAHFYNVRPALPIFTTMPKMITIGPVNEGGGVGFAYVALGDSLTAGEGAIIPTGTFPYQLAQHLQKGGLPVYVTNLAVPGATSAEVLRNQIPQLADMPAEFITLLIGVNDLHNHVPLAEFKQNLRAILNELDKGSADVQVLTIPYLGSKHITWPPYRAYFDWQTRRYNRAIVEAVEQSHAGLIDLYSLTREAGFSDLTYYSPDGFHPSESGYTLWSAKIYDTLDR